MATSGTYTFTVTQSDIIRESMLNMGKLGASDPIGPQEYLDMQRKLNLMVKQWMGRTDFAPGLKMWTRSRGDLFLSSSKFSYQLGQTGDNYAGGVTAVPGQNYATSTLAVANAGGSAVLNVGATNAAQFTVGDYVVVQLNSGDIFSSTVLSIASPSVTLTTNVPSAANSGNYVWNYTVKQVRPLEIQTAVLRDSNQNDTPLNFMTLQTYENLPNKVATGVLSDPTSIYYEQVLTNGVLYIDVAGASDVTKNIHIVGLRPIQDFVNTTDNPDYPAEWFDALCWGLTKRGAPMFNAPWTQEMQDNHDVAIRTAREAYPETTELFFQCNAGDP